MAYFASPLIEQKFPNAASSEAQQRAARGYVAAHVGEVLASYPRFEGFHKPNFFKGGVFVAEQLPALAEIQKLSAAGSPREIGFATLNGKWLVIVGAAHDSIVMPPELKGVATMVAHTHPIAHAFAPLPSFEDLNLLRGKAEYIFSPEGVTKYGPIKPEFAEQGKSFAKYEENPSRMKFDLYLHRTHVSQQEERSTTYFNFLQEVYGAERASWQDREAVKALLGEHATQQGASRAV